MNGWGSGRREPPTVTACSCIASSRADCVLGVARLTSSARTMFAKMGPARKSRRARPCSSCTSVWLPVMSAGMRSGVNWIRENSRSSASAITRTSSVLPRPGCPSTSTLPRVSSPTIACSTRTLWPKRRCSISAFSAPRCSCARTIRSSLIGTGVTAVFMLIVPVRPGSSCGCSRAASGESARGGPPTRRSTRTCCEGRRRPPCRGSPRRSAGSLSPRLGPAR